jgi:hypothetical protein
MLRLCSESSCSYPGRPVCHAGCSFPGEITGRGQPVSQKSRHFLEGLLPEDEIRSQEKQTRKEISSVMQDNLCDEGAAAVALRAMAGQGSQQPVRA